MAAPLPKGSIRFARRCRRRYAVVKVSGPPARWDYLQRVVWTHEHGPIPEGMVVWFRNGDSTDCRAENLELISRGMACWRLRQLYAGEWRQWHQRAGAAGGHGLIKARAAEMKRREKARLAKAKGNYESVRQ